MLAKILLGILVIAMWLATFAIMLLDWTLKKGHIVEQILHPNRQNRRFMDTQIMLKSSQLRALFFCLASKILLMIILKKAVNI